MDYYELKMEKRKEFGSTKSFIIMLKERQYKESKYRIQLEYKSNENYE